MGKGFFAFALLLMTKTLFKPVPTELLGNWKIVWAYLPERGPHIQSGTRPCILLGPSIAFQHSPVFQVIPLTTSGKRQWLSCHVKIELDEQMGLYGDSTALLEQICTIDKEQILSVVGEVPEQYIQKIKQALDFQLFGE